MSSRKGDDSRPGSDKPYYTTPAGVVHGSAFLSEMTGTPPAPAERGGPKSVGSSNLDGGSPRTSDNGVPSQFFHKDRDY